MLPANVAIPVLGLADDRPVSFARVNLPFDSDKRMIEGASIRST
jgi:hypothetical protein